MKKKKKMVLHILNERALPNFKLSIDTLTSSKGEACKCQDRIKSYAQKRFSFKNHDKENNDYNTTNLAARPP
jgi:hypothetical protein